MEVGAAATLTRGQWFRTAEGSAAAALIVRELQKRQRPTQTSRLSSAREANALKGTAATSLSKAVDLFGISSELVRTCQKAKTWSGVGDSCDGYLHRRSVFVCAASVIRGVRLMWNLL